jgi:hypothetical protein
MEKQMKLALSSSTTQAGPYRSPDNYRIFEERLHVLSLRRKALPAGSRERYAAA